jgi:aminopeptidase N
MQSPLFSLTTPNKVRALIGNFAMANPSQFNSPDGAGYKFLAEQVLAIEKFNPQVAARLLNAFRSWRALEPERRAKAKRVLQGLAKTEGLSRDVFEIAAKMIE